MGTNAGSQHSWKETDGGIYRRYRVDAENDVALPNVGEKFSVGELQFVYICHVPSHGHRCVCVCVCVCLCVCMRACAWVCACVMGARKGESPTVDAMALFCKILLETVLLNCVPPLTYKLTY